MWKEPYKEPEPKTKEECNKLYLQMLLKYKKYPWKSTIDKIKCYNKTRSLNCLDMHKNLRVVIFTKWRLANPN